MIDDEIDFIEQKYNTLIYNLRNDNIFFNFLECKLNHKICPLMKFAYLYFLYINEQMNNDFILHLGPEREFKKFYERYRYKT